MIVDVFSKWVWLVGGGDRVTASVVEALLEEGHEVILHTTQPVNLHVLGEMFDKEVDKVTLKIHDRCQDVLRPIRLGRMYVNLVSEFLEHSPMKGDLFVDLSPASCLGATYLRLPDIAYWNPPGDFHEIIAHARDGHIYRRIAFVPYLAILLRLMDRMNSIPVNFVNSRYTETVIRDFYLGRLHTELELLYPPVDIESWIEPESFERKGVISVARFAPWKRHDLQLKIVGSDISLTMVGGARDVQEINTVHSLEKLRGPNVRVLINQPISQLRHLLWSSKVFIHTADNEPFGLSIVEAIAAGCIPIIRNCGGAVEIVPFRDLTFDTVEEAREKVRRALSGDCDRYLPKLREHIKQFDETIFRQRFLEKIVRRKDD